MRCSSYRSWTVVTCLLTLAASSALAQPAEPKVRSATFYTIKPGSGADFRSALKDWAEMVRKAGTERYYSVWAAQSGSSEIVLVSNHKTWAELDAGPDPKLKDVAAQRANLSARIGNCIQSSRREIASLESDLGLPVANAAVPDMVRVIRTWVRPEHHDAYRNLVKTELLPAAKKSGLKLWSVARVRYGGSPYEYNTAASVANWAEMDGESPIVTALGGQAGYQKFLAKQRPMITRSEYQMYRLLKDHSYLPPAR